MLLIAEAISQRHDIYIGSKDLSLAYQSFPGQQRWGQKGYNPSLFAWEPSKAQGACAEGSTIGYLRCDSVMGHQLPPSLLRTADNPVSEVHRSFSVALHPTYVPFSFVLPVVRTAQPLVQVPYSSRQNLILPTLLRSPEIALFIAMILWC